MCQAKPGRRCSTHASQSVQTAKQAETVCGEKLEAAEKRVQAAEQVTAAHPNATNQATVTLLKQRALDERDAYEQAVLNREQAELVYYSTNAGLVELNNKIETEPYVNLWKPEKVVDLNGVEHTITVPSNTPRKLVSLKAQAEDLAEWQKSAYRRLHDTGMGARDQANEGARLISALQQKENNLENKRAYFMGLVREHATRWEQDPDDVNNIAALGRALENVKNTEQALWFNRIKTKEINGFMRSLIFKPTHGTVKA